MFKHVLKVAVLSFIALNANALPIEEADAFVIGDHKAALEKDTGLVWMDFDINTDTRYTDMLAHLDSKYDGWRFATVPEIKHLWFNLFAGLSVPITGSGQHLYLADNNGDEGQYFKDLLRIFDGYDSTTSWFNDAGEPILIPYKYSFSFFLTDAGLIGTFGFGGPIEDSRLGPNLAMLELYGQPDDVFMVGAMLVKNTNVPEPSSIFLLSLGVFCLVFARRRAAK